MGKFLVGVLIGLWVEGYLQRKEELSDESIGALIERWEVEEFGDFEWIEEEDE